VVKIKGASDSTRLSLLITIDLTIMQASSSQTDPVAASSDPYTTKGWSLDGLLDSGPRFKRVPRISATSGLNELFLKVVEHENKGIPLIIEGWQDRPEWPRNLFDLDWLKETHGSQGTLGCHLRVYASPTNIAVIEARNIHGNRKDQKLLLSELVDCTRAAPPFATPDETSRLYGKDMECPSEWQEWLATRFALDALRPCGSADLMHSTVQTLMCYLGISDTCKLSVALPIHRAPNNGAKSHHAIKIFADRPAKI
jgi:hypothetical protein